jgi:hypothetical protein
MNSQPSGDLTSLLGDRLRTGTSSDQIAELMDHACQGIDEALAPILGKRGVAALLTRSMHLTSKSHNWMVGATGADRTVAEELKSSLARQTSAEAASGGLLFLKTFNDLLTSLIGPSLTDRLLRSVWANVSGDKP